MVFRYLSTSSEYVPDMGVFVVDEEFNTITKDPVTRAGSFMNTDHALKFVARRQHAHPRTKLWQTCKVIRFPVGASGPVEIVTKVKDNEKGTWEY